MDKYLTDKSYWNIRSQKYNQLQWTRREGYLNTFAEMCQLQGNEKALDLGTGTGTIAYVLNKKVKHVLGVDNSIEMLKKAEKHNHAENVEFKYADIRKMPFPDNSFDLVTTRMVFHHLLWGMNRAISEVRRVLKPGGLFCLSEGIPPCKCVDAFYKAIFLLKEKRLTFYEEDLKKLFREGKFKRINIKRYIMTKCSVKNWLNNSGNLTDEIKKQIYGMHINLHQEGKNSYNMKITDDDCFINMHFIIISGRK